MARWNVARLESDRLRQMNPTGAPDNAAYLAFPYAIARHQRVIGYATRRVGSDCQHRPFIQTGLPILHAAIARTAPFGNTVGGVVVIRPEKKVARIDATRSVATVTNNHTGRDGSVRQFPRNAMGKLVPTFNTNATITTSHFIGCPQVATIGASTLVNLLPEMHGEFFGGILGGHRNLLTLRCHSPDEDQSSRGFSMPILPDRSPKNELKQAYRLTWTPEGGITIDPI